MRMLLLFRGCAGCGKSTIIEKYGLIPYTLSSDSIRLLYSSPVLNVNGEYNISNYNEKKVWNLLFELLEERMKMGQFTVIDAMNSRISDFNKYKKLAEKYRYRIVCVDLSSINIDVIKNRNSKRQSYKRVPEHVIDNICLRLHNKNIPSYVNAIELKDLYDTLIFKPIDLTHYEAIHVIGDIHGCYTALKQYIGENLNKKHLYIFTGDYIDRGIENAQTLNFLFTLYNEPNVIMLEGNHERWLWNWANFEQAKSPEFENRTRKELELRKVDRTEVRKFYKKLRQIAYFTYHDKTFLITHGGLSTLPDNLTYVATEQLIKGVGSYEDNIDEIFLKNTSNNIFQIHGHRNTQNFPIRVNERCFTLEGKVEIGGALRILRIEKDNFKEIEINNTVYNKDRFMKKIVV